MSPTTTQSLILRKKGGAKQETSGFKITGVYVCVWAYVCVFVWLVPLDHVNVCLCVFMCVLGGVFMNRLPTLQGIVLPLQGSEITNRHLYCSRKPASLSLSCAHTHAHAPAPFSFYRSE